MEPGTTVIDPESHDGDAVVLVTGGNGYIGSHIAKHYHARGFRVRVVDISPHSPLDPQEFYTERVIGNLTDLHFCRRVVRGATIVLHFAAVAGANAAHSEDEHVIYRLNHTISQNILEASVEAGVRTFFLASSAAVYPFPLSAGSDSNDLSLEETSVYPGQGEPPKPQGTYGLERLHAEELFLQYNDRMSVRIGRLFPVYGPHGSLDGEDESSPVGILRKAIALRLAQTECLRFEIPEDPFQPRFYLYIDDAVAAVAALVDAPDAKPPLNIAPSQTISSLDLAKLSLEVAGLDLAEVELVIPEERTTGTAGWSSENSLIERELGWTPRVGYMEGLTRTAAWMSTRANRLLSDTYESTYPGFHIGRTVNRALLPPITFAVLLPITSRGALQTACIDHLRNFSHSLHETTWRDRRELGGTRYRVNIYLAVDEDDEYLLPAYPGAEGRAEAVLREYGFSEITTLRCSYPRGHVCALWRDTARRAFKDDCDYFILMGDDVELIDEGWMRTIDAKFTELAASVGGPKGFGCVAFTDTSFPGMPTFPVVHRVHMEIFAGEVVPSLFINQDGDPYLFQLYRHFGTSTTVPLRLRNLIGGSDDARYEKYSLDGWTFEVLEQGKTTVADWLRQHGNTVQQIISLDIIVPSYRVDLEILGRILRLEPSPTCSTMFIIIVDNPTSPVLYELIHTYSHRMDVRIRVNKSNQGASASRNRGLSESSAEWAAFLDDDVLPVPEYLVEAERAIRAHQDAAGFVGNAYFPTAPNIFTTAVHLAGVTYFWDIADKIAEDVPWGITANLIVRRNIRDNIKFQLSFPKTGGGEDIDYCRQKRKASLDRGGTAFWAAPKVAVTHPWWGNAQRSYRRFFMWAYGDGELIRLYPEISWRDWTPNAPELMLLSSGLALSGLGLGFF